MIDHDILTPERYERADIILNELLKNRKENNMRERLKNHIGHNIRCVCYGDDPNDPDDICIECWDCNEVLVSAETFEFEEEKV